MSGKIKIWTLISASALSLAACDLDRSTDRDYGIDGRFLEQAAAGIWIDANGCDHWIIDDGVEGYMSPRLTPTGEPVCREGSVPYSTIDFERTLFGK